jgi:pyruvate dehydrogenase E1 component alpha subunit
MMTKEELIAFEDDIAKLYEAGQIRAPIHLAGTNEDELIRIFEQEYKPNDWIFSTWRNHYHWLLSGRDPEDLKNQIVTGHSMHVFGERFFTSSIVGGIASIAVGVALALKLKGVKDSRVICFLGDMGARTGQAMEAMMYACGHDLPILFVIEDNGMSVRAKTQEVWGEGVRDCTQEYVYERKFPHAGTGKYVMF